MSDVSVDSPSDSQACFGVEWTVEELHDRIAGRADSVDEFSDPAFGEHTLEVVFDQLGVPEGSTDLRAISLFAGVGRVS